MIEAGTRRAILINGPCPDLPAFLALCEQENRDGLPSADEAYREACMLCHAPANNRTWSHEVVRHAYSQVGPYEIKTLPASKSWPLFKNAYERICRAIANGEPLPAIPKQIEDTSSCAAASPQTARSAIFSLRQMFRNSELGNDAEDAAMGGP